MRTITLPAETKAIKEHRCSFCDEKIRVGDVYIKSTHEYDGRIYDWKTHKQCSRLADKMNMYEDCDEGLTGDVFQENVREKHYELLTAGLQNEDYSKYTDIISQIRYVQFRYMLQYVIRYYNKPTTP